MTTYLSQQTTMAELAEEFDELTSWASRFGALLFDNLELRPHLRILDIGCATGFPLFELARVHGPSSSVIGIDIWQDALAHITAKKRVYKQENVGAAAADASQLPFAASSFDLIVSNLGINNFSDPHASFSECYRVAAPGARLVLTTNLMGHMAEFYAAYHEVLTKLDLTQYLPNVDDQEAHRGTVASVSALLQQAGFQVTRTVESSFKMHFLDADSLFNHHLIRIGFLDGWRSIVTPAEEAAVFHALETTLDETAAQQGQLTFTVPMLYIEAEKPTQ